MSASKRQLTLNGVALTSVILYEGLSDPEAAMRANFEFADFESSFREIADEIFQRGFAAGSEDMRRKILRAAGGVEDEAGSQPVVAASASSRPAEAVFGSQSDALDYAASISDHNNRVRAPHGAVADAVQSVLSERPGIFLNEVMDLATQRDSRITRSSVGTELRRYLTDRYTRDADGRWFLGGTPPDQDSTEAPLEEHSVEVLADEGG